jgi:plastocyanin
MKTIIGKSGRFLRPIGLILIILTILLGCSKSKDTTTPGANEVLIQSFAFSPTTITVSVNSTITWTNKDAAAHTVTSDNGLFDSGNMNTDATFSHQFTTAGTFPYHCTYHSNMLAKVIVQ